MTEVTYQTADPLGGEEYVTKFALPWPCIDEVINETKWWWNGYTHTMRVLVDGRQVVYAWRGCAPGTPEVTIGDRKPTIAHDHGMLATMIIEAVKKELA